MTFSLETKSDAAGLRRTGFPSIGDAKIASGVGAGEIDAAAVYEGDSPEFGDGTLVSLIGRETGWLDVHSAPAPQWWNGIEPEIRRWILGHGPASLPSFVWIPIVSAGGAVQTVQWDNADPAGMTVTLSDEQWAELQREFEALS